MKPYVVEVETSTHDALQKGITALPRVPGGPDYTVVVIAPQEAPGGDWEAMLIAAQMAACTSGGMPTATRLISWPIDEES